MEGWPILIHGHYREATAKGTKLLASPGEDLAECL